MDDHARTASEATAVIVIHALRTRTSLCIPGATDVRPVATLPEPSSPAIVPNVAEARMQTD